MTTSTLSLGYDCPEEQAADSRWSSLAVLCCGFPLSSPDSPVSVARDLRLRDGAQMIWKKMMTIATQLTKNAAVRR